eukprot:CAMPEP_0172715004 /NCGR_PEP_ID=MMETSP1074-20121228/67295_1 /TAXON_ID=2916 /ORGANISM="Ceratium fusus, Strain PA161109" /LENGTH=319 /DNA_ID=CAMNT_0013539535 /DNA_START=57 /DNA_END=1013 /DNA_ORIENTATION=-
MSHGDLTWQLQWLYLLDPRPYGPILALLASAGVGLSMFKDNDGDHRLVKKTSMLVMADKFDKACGKRIFVTIQRSPLRHVAELLSLSGDEAVWMVGPLLVGIGLLLGNLGPSPGSSLMVELWGDVLMCSAVETGLKACLRRQRPEYAKQSSFCTLPGEWWSCPSGHAMRSAFLARRFFCKPFIAYEDLGPAAASTFSAGCFLWAFLVGWSRIAKGRHFPGDVLLGLLFGYILAWLAAYVGLPMWCCAKLVAGSVTGAEAAFMFARPDLRLEGFKFHLIAQTFWWLSQPLGLGLDITYTQVMMGLFLPVNAIFLTLGTLS